MGAQLNIVALSPNEWDGQWVNRQHLLSRLGRLHQIIYSNGAWSVWDRHRADFLASAWSGTFEEKDGVLVDRPGRGMMRWPRFHTWDELAMGFHARRLKTRFTTPAPLVAYICHPSYWPYVRALGPDYIVYHCYDLYERQPGWSASLAAAEMEILKAADLVFSPTTMLSAMLMTKAPCYARTLANAADVKSIFAAAEHGVAMPGDLAAIPEPRIGYVGSLHPELDFELVAELALRRPEWQFVLIGPEQKSDVLQSLPGYKECRVRPNVHLLGERPRSAIPAYLLHMNVNIMFYKTSPGSWTEVAYPLKLHEYLASGLPVVSVELQMIQEFSGPVAFVAGAEAWERALADAIRDNNPELRTGRQAIAAMHGWETRVEVLDAWLAELPQLKAKRVARHALGSGT